MEIIDKILFCIGNKEITWSEFERLNVPADIFTRLLRKLSYNGQLVYDRAEVTIPEGVRDLDFAFEEAPIVSVHLPSTIRSLCQDCFVGASHLREITGTETLVSVGVGSFYNTYLDTAMENQRLNPHCTVYKNLLLDVIDLHETIEIPSEITCIMDAAFGADCVNATRVVLPEGIDRIPRQCFSSSKNLSIVECRGKLIELGDFAFNNTNLSEIPSQETIERVGKYAFRDTCLDMVNLPMCREIKSGAFLKSTVRDIKLPNIQIIRLGAFAGCKRLHSIEFGRELECIEENTFGGTCEKLKRVTLSRKTDIQDSTLKKLIDQGQCSVRYID